MTDAHDRYQKQAMTLVDQISDFGFHIRPDAALRIASALAAAAQPVVWTTEKPTTEKPQAGGKG